MRCRNGRPCYYLWAAILFAGCAAGANAAGGPVTEFALTGEGQRPQAIVVGPDGNVWATEVLKHQIVRVTPKGEVTAFAVPGKDVGVLQGLAVGPDGNLWFTSREENAIRRVTPKGEFNGTFTIPSKAATENKVMKGSWPRGITADPDGNLWFSENGSDRIGRITPKGEISGFDLPKGTQPIGIAAGGDGNIWFTAFKTHKIGRITPAGKITWLDLATENVQPFGMTAGPDGTVWFTEQANKVGRIDTEAAGK